MNSLTIIFSILSIISIGNAAKILCVFPAAAHSHYTIGYSLAKEDVRKHTEERFSEKSIFDMVNVPNIAMLAMVGEMGLWTSETTYSDKTMQALLNSNETYDAVITEAFATDALQGIAYRFKAPSILVTTIGPSIWTNYVTASPSVYSYMSHPFLSYTQKMTFCQRIINILTAFLQNCLNAVYYLPQQDKILHKYVPEAPNLYDLIKNTSLYLFNSDPVLNVPLPLVPNTKEIGGIHIEPPKKLPADLQKYLDDSKEGVIYFSMGGNLKSKELPQATRE
ncbi:UDP-glucoronosyl and UDP-glucosyl transferase [Popillia japonica]|uniref:UDP-glucoronosyl and UDP-glucosyl transferase n=1 Tax=Popillia japonica TaxID=7064 RepID=A0AAW1LM16_POPJA